MFANHPLALTFTTKVFFPEVSILFALFPMGVPHWASFLLWAFDFFFQVAKNVQVRHPQLSIFRRAPGVVSWEKTLSGHRAWHYLVTHLLDKIHCILQFFCFGLLLNHYSQRLRQMAQQLQAFSPWCFGCSLQSSVAMWTRHILSVKHDRKLHLALTVQQQSDISIMLKHQKKLTQRKFTSTKSQVF